ncbi:MAG: hypothetical protein K9W46_07985 [Candidatus Heimdallarchaeum endolithica]|uniref:Uncharacterized protein n=1 Tax=Candidatus Heimdallarchaeum endolithica TaxID=2876572 RepID=A0A9Y1FM60_9ARCH|nr:MAG: hypothetical protein K9W46_07985 [Candidatus Heimdallarchaeum endolithica]
MTFSHAKEWEVLDSTERSKGRATAPLMTPAGKRSPCARPIFIQPTASL